jgi:hypothetical protein
MKMATTKVNSYERKGALDSNDVEIKNGTATMSMEDTRTGRDVLGAMEIDLEVPKGPVDMSLEQFMAQEIEVLLADAANDDENQFVEVKVNGDYRIGRRGEMVMLKRYHVGVLAQAKELRMKQTRIVLPDGSMGYQEQMVSKQTYPFSVLNDPAGRKGSDWLRGQLQNAR